MEIEYYWGDPPYKEELKPFTLLSQCDSNNIQARRADNDELVGIATYYDDEFGTKWLSELEVLPDYRRLGIGTTLLKLAIDEGVTALNVYKNNFDAIRIYLDAGFVFDRDNKLNIKIKDKDLIGMYLQKETK